jgi:hypothetical protein
MLPTLSLPIVCYLRHFLLSDNGKPIDSMYLNCWLSSIYSASGQYLGHRWTQKIGGRVETRTYDADGEDVSNEYVNEIESTCISTRVISLSVNSTLRKFYQVIDSSTIECTTSGPSAGLIRSSETFTAEPGHESLKWQDIFLQSEWFCILWDGDRNEVGTRSIYVSQHSARIKTNFGNRSKSEFEIIRQVPSDVINEFGSYSNYIERCKTDDVGADKKVSRGGIILDSSGSMDRHQRLATKLSIKR